jgi:hypothetical protein
MIGLADYRANRIVLRRGHWPAHKLASSEIDACGELNLPRPSVVVQVPKSVVGLLPRPGKYGRVIHAIKRWMVKQIIEFSSELQGYSLLDRNVLKQCDVPIVGARTAEHNFAGVTDKFEYWPLLPTVFTGGSVTTLVLKYRENVRSP